MEINFRHEINGQKVITAIAQDWKTGQILMVANMNKEALQKQLKLEKPITGVLPQFPMAER